ncbi:MAG TPA: cytochrome c biogenesis protein CcsA [Planctomycetota bacterium]|nr:cytochrome c biogenesis protein CcsA [Planctomycetota bacterium]
MDVALKLLLIVLPVGYFAVARRAAADFRDEREAPGGPARRFPLERLVFALHLASVVWLSLRLGAVAAQDGAQTLHLLALALFGVFLWASRGGEARALGLFVAGGAFLLEWAAVALDPARLTATVDGRGALFAVHVLTAVIAAAVMLLSGCAGLVYLTLERQMRRKTFGLLYSKLPNLAELATLNRRAAGFGFLFMTAGVNLGIWLAHRDRVKDFSYLDPQVLATLALWIHFGLVALPRRVAFVTGARAAKASAAGFVLLLLTLLVSAIPGLSFHRFS